MNPRAPRRFYRNNRPLQSGQVGEVMAEQWFANHGWRMVRTQPPVTILGIITPAIVAVLRRFIPRLVAFGHMVIARMGKGGVADYSGFVKHTVCANLAEPYEIALYRACEVKEAAGDSMEASRLDKDQRAFMAGLPAGCAFVGIFWKDVQKFSMHPFIERGSYRREGITGESRIERHPD